MDAVLGEKCDATISALVGAIRPVQVVAWYVDQSARRRWLQPGFRDAQEIVLVCVQVDAKFQDFWFDGLDV